MKNKNTKLISNQEPKRKLSLFRLILALAVAAGIYYASSTSWNSLKQSIANASIKPWFAPYVDVTSTPRYGFEQYGDTPSQKNIVLAFIVTSADDACTPSWGGAYSLDDAGTKLDLDRRIALYRQKGGNLAISFGGLLNDELAINCNDPEKLLQAYNSVIDRYNIDTIDLDLEGIDLTNSEAMKRRASTIARLQKSQTSGKSIAVWLTLPVSTHGLTEDGTNAVAQFLSSGVDLAGLNAMTMDFGQSRDKNETMLQASEKALQETHRQLGILYKKAGINLSDASLWTKIGATAMIGQNDFADEIFTLDDAKGLNEFAISKSITRLSIWSGNRDVECGENYVNVTVVSDSCSGVKQERFGYSDILSQDFAGDIISNSTLVTKSDPETVQQPDDPQNSPYQIWSESGAYLEGTKVVWHHSVYQAKWWTSGDLPDDPVLQAWQTPWQIIGPVLPGEKPIPQPTLPAGTFPVWEGATVYDVGQRVLFYEIPYEAKWWTQGDSPAASTSNPDNSPWRVLTQKEIDKILGNSNSNEL